MLVLRRHRLLPRRNLDEGRRNLDVDRRHHLGVGLHLDAVHPHRQGVARLRLGDQEHLVVDHLGDPCPAKAQMGYYLGVKLDEGFPYPGRQQTGCCLGAEFRGQQKVKAQAQLDLLLQELRESDLTKLVKQPPLRARPLA